MRSNAYNSQCQSKVIFGEKLWTTSQFRKWLKMGPQRKARSGYVPRGKIIGAKRFGRVWAIPVDAERPADGKVKSGKYIKKKGGADND